MKIISIRERLKLIQEANRREKAKLPVTDIPVKEFVTLPIIEKIGVVKAIIEPSPEPQPTFTIQSPIPIPFLGLFPSLSIGGDTTPQFGFKTLPELLTDKPQETEAIVYPSPFIPFTPKIGPDVPVELIKIIEDLDPVITPLPITPPVPLVIPDWPKLPDLGAIGKYALIIGGALAGVYILGKVLGRKT